MRFLHISDLHIGKRIHNKDLIEDQRAVLRQIPEMVKEYGCDAVLIAGDIYDRSQPSEKAIALVDAFLRDLSATGKHIYMISGNHDNQAQVSYLSGILQRSGIYTSVPVSLRPQKYTETDSYGEIDIYLLPFLRLSAINRLFPDDPSQTLEEAVSMLLKSYDIDPKRRNVLVCHQFIRGASKGGSEEMSIGGLEEISSSLLQVFDYAALGHIHAPQRAGSESIQYCGSLLKYHFDECDQKKGALIVDVMEKGALEVKKVPFVPLHDMRRIKGRFSDIMEHQPSEDYIEVILEDENMLSDARGALQAVFPNLLSLRLERKAAGGVPEAVMEPEEDSLLDHFRNFYRLQHDGREASEKAVKAVTDILLEMEEGR